MRQAQDQRFRVTSAHKNGPRAATSAEPAETSRRARPAVEAAGRAKNQRFLVTSAHKNGSRAATRVGPAGASQEPAAGASKRFSTAPQERRTSGDQPAKQDQRLGRASASLQRLKSGGPAGASQEPAAGASKRFSTAPQEHRSSRSESVRQARARTSQSTAGIPKGQARADEAKHWVYARYKRVRRNSRTAECGRPDLRESCLLRH